MPSILATASRTSASDEVGHTGVLSHFEPRRLPFYLTFASVVSVLCSNSASNCLIGAALGALLVCHFRFGDALRFPPVPRGAYMHLHNVYLQYAAERGVPALLVYLWFLGRMLWDFGRAARRTPAEERERRFVLHGALAVMIAALSAGWYEHNLNDGEILTMFLAVCACAYMAVPAAGGTESKV